MATPSDNLPWSEKFRLAGEVWAEREAAASLLEDTKSSVMAQRQTMLGDMPVNRSEQIVKASPEWTQHVEQIVEARKQANLAKIEMEYTRMKFTEWQNAEANNRMEARLVA